MKTLTRRFEDFVRELLTRRSFCGFVVLWDGKDTIGGTAKAPLVRRKAAAILDFFDAAQYSPGVSRSILGNGERARRWHRWRGDQLLSENDTVLKLVRSSRLSLRRLPAGGQASEVLHGAIEDFRVKRSCMRHAEFIVRGLRIGSRPVQAGAENMVATRLKLSEMRWSWKGGQRVLAHRAFVKSERWERRSDAYVEVTWPAANQTRVLGT